MTKCARSEMNNRPVQSSPSDKSAQPDLMNACNARDSEKPRYLPWDSRPSSSSNMDGMLITSPEPTNAIHLGLMRPRHGICGVRDETVFTQK
jgi:hypothetical protein